MKPWWGAAALLVFVGGALAQDEPIDAPQPDKSVRDTEFGVVARHFGLERQVEMYQWRAARQGYAKAWSAQPVDAAGFSPGHANPPFPLQGRRWLAKSISIDGKLLDVEVIASLGRWHDFRPSFSALPGNLVATFQPEGDGLGSAENPLDPQIGDLRIRWRELILPPLQGRIAMRDGRWRLLAGKPATASASDASDTAVDPARPRRAPWLFGSGAVIVLLAVIAAARRRRRESSKQSGE